jgi:transcriptional regulator with PAS, ATPase and Fis domain
VGTSEGISSAKEWAKITAAASPVTVLITGETGTGKEMFAQAIHNASSRRNGPFIALNCAALPENLIESELFGFEDGTFTGARKGGRPGKFEMAAGGTIFLDEIGDMALSAQMKLLRVIQEKKVTRIGSAEEVPNDVRIIAATHKDLQAEVQKGNFREDLFFRLSVLEVEIPPLRERMEDVLPLARYLAQKVAARLGKDTVDIDDEFLLKLQSHGWPGNIRELENVLERAVIRANGNARLTPNLLDFAFKKNGTKEYQPKTIREAEKDLIFEALDFHKWNIERTSSVLGICRTTLHKKICVYGGKVGRQPRATHS